MQLFMPSGHGRRSLSDLAHSAKDDNLRRGGLPRRRYARGARIVGSQQKAVRPNLPRAASDGATPFIASCRAERRGHCQKSIRSPRPARRHICPIMRRLKRLRSQTSSRNLRSSEFRPQIVLKYGVNLLFQQRPLMAVVEELHGLLQTHRDEQANDDSSAVDEEALAGLDGIMGCMGFEHRRRIV